MSDTKLKRQKMLSMAEFALMLVEKNNAEM